MIRIPITVTVAALAVCCSLLPAEGPKLPTAGFSAVIHDNDDHRDVYTDEYLLALAAIGEARLAALITTYTPNPREYDLFVKGRAEIAAMARRSGFADVPPAVAGPGKRLQRPASGRMEDTVPDRSAGARAIVAAAREAAPERPLVVVTGGPVSAVADAWLLDPSIADRVVVSGLFGVPERDYNAGLDGWAWAIVVSNFRVLAVPIGPPKRRGVVYEKPPVVSKSRIAAELPGEVEMFRWMLDKKHPSNVLPNGHDYDGQVAIPLTRPDYITKISRWRVAGLEADGIPRFERDAGGPLFVAEDANQDVATEEFWRVMKKAAAAVGE